MGALKIGRALLIAWAAIASLGVAYMGYRSGWMVGELRTTRADLIEAQSANDDWSDAAALLQSSLDTCEAQFETVQNTAARDRNKRDAEIAALEERLQETQSDLSQTLEDEATPELAACLPLPVPDNSLIGCGPRQIVRPEPVETERRVWKDVPEDRASPLPYLEPPKTIEACIVTFAPAAYSIIEQANKDRKAVRNLEAPDNE